MSDNNDFSGKFMEALGANWGDSLLAGTQGLWGGTSHVRDMIANKPASQLLDAFEQADERLKPLLDVARNDPALAEALKNAVAKDPTVLQGLEEMANGDGSGIFDSKLIDRLNDPTLGPTLRSTLTNALNKVADEDDVNFSYLKNLIEQGQTMAKAGEMFNLLLTNPDQFVKEFLNSMEFADPAIKEMAAGAMSICMPFIKMFVDPNGFMLGPYTEFAQHYGLTNPMGIVDGLRERGQAVLDGVSFQADAERTGGGLSAAPDMNASYDLASLGISPTITPEQERLLREHDAKNDVDTVPTPAPAPALAP